MYLLPPLFVSAGNPRIPCPHPPPTDVSGARELVLMDHREGVSGCEAFPALSD